MAQARYCPYGRLSRARRVVFLLFLALAVVSAQLSFQMAVGAQSARAAAYTVTVREDGYGSEKRVDYTYDKSKLALKNAEFDTNNQGSSPKDGGELGFWFKEDKNTRIAYSRAASTYQLRDGAIIIRGNTKPGEHKVKGWFDLVWRDAVKDAYGKLYDLHMRVSNVTVKNPTGLVFQNGVAIMQGSFVEQGKVNSKEKTWTDPKEPDRKRDLYRERTVDADKPFTATKSADDDDEEDEDQGSTSACAWVCNFNGNTKYRNIEKLHEAYYTSVRKGDTWDGKTWELRKDPDDKTKWVKSDKYPGNRYQKHWEVHNPWTGAKSGADDLSDNEVGVTMDVSSYVTPAESSGASKAASSAPVKGGTLGMGFRDIDQPALGKDGDDYAVGTYMESVSFRKGFLGSDGSSTRPVIHVNDGTALRSGGKKISDGSKVSRVHGGKRTTKADSKDSGFTCKVDASGFEYSWAGAKCATPLFTPTKLDGNIDIAVSGTKTVNDAPPGKARAGLFSFRLYRERLSNSDDDTAVKSWSNANQKLDANGKVTEGSGKGGTAHANIKATNAADGSFAFRLNYWTLLHALGYKDTGDLMSIKDGNGLFGKDFKFVVGEKTDTKSIKSGRYVVWKGDANLTLRLASDGKGGAVATVTYEDGERALIKNVETADARISVNKRLVNGTGLPSPDIAGKYVFALAAETPGAPLPGSSGAVAKNPGAEGGQAIFGLMRFSEPGDYRYKVTESRADDVEPAFAVRDDPAAQSGKSVVVHVARETDSEGASHTVANVEAADASYEYTSTGGTGVGGIKGVEFQNVYEPPAVRIPVTKILQVGKGATAPDIAGKYTFRLAAAKNGSRVSTGSGISVPATAPMPASGGEKVANPSADGGTAEFGKIVYTAPGVYRYTVSETGSVDGVYNDDVATKDVEVTVGDDASAKVNGGAGLSFTNKVPSPATISLGAVKTFVTVPAGISLPNMRGKFSFALSALSEGAPVPQSRTTVTNPDADGGTARFGAISFERAGEYRYLVTEKGEVEGVTNDSDAKNGKRITVTVSFDRDANALRATADPDTAAVGFRNVYRPSVAMPVAGGNASWAIAGIAGALLAACGVRALLRKRRAS